MNLKNESKAKTEVVSTADVRHILGNMGTEQVSAEEIELFLSDIGFKDDHVCNVDDFAQFLLE